MIKLISAKDGKQLYYKLNNQAFVVGLNSNGNAVASILDASSRHQLKNFIQVAQDTFQEDNLTYKVIGPSSALNALVAVLSNFSNDEVKKVPREGTFEVMFFPEDGKLRVTKSEEKPAPVENIKRDIKVLIVDDSKTIRNLLNKVFTKAEGIEVCGMAEKPSDVEELIKKHKPDVLTLDIHMPEMTGVELLKIIGPKYNIPTIMVTSISMEEGPLVLEALELGAFDYIQKPEVSELPVVAPILVEKVKEAALSKKSASQINKLGARPVSSMNLDSLVVIGSSTGGTNALKDILTKLPKQVPPILIVQHIPPVFSKAFADRMNGLCPFTVKEAEDGEVVASNKVLIAPGGKQMKVVNEGGTFKVNITDDAPVNRFKPSVDYLFQSTVPLIKRKHVVSVILTGMGKDGAKEMLNLKNAGAYTIGQDEESCVVYGMPKEAARIGAVMHAEHKDDIASKMAELSWPSNDDKEEAS
jgi:two-component system chemotaxis response regulator CheB